MVKLDEHIEKILFTKEDLEKRVIEVADEINRDYRGRHINFVVILKGAFVFCADLIRHIDADISVGFMVVSSYGGATRSSGTVRIVKDLQKNIEGEDVILVEDIVDTGLTICHLKELLATRHPASLKVCSLLSKPSCRVVEVKVDYLGFDIPDEFVVGYGLDYGQNYRQLPYVGVMKASAIKVEHGGTLED
jgi:hypoxanthine phosphoribosyltransferase